MGRAHWGLGMPTTARWPGRERRSVRSPPRRLKARTQEPRRAGQARAHIVMHVAQPALHALPFTRVVTGIAAYQILREIPGEGFLE